MMSDSHAIFLSNIPSNLSAKKMKQVILNEFGATVELFFGKNRGRKIGKHAMVYCSSSEEKELLLTSIGSSFTLKGNKVAAKSATADFNSSFMSARRSKGQKKANKGETPVPYNKSYPKDPKTNTIGTGEKSPIPNS